MLTSVSDFISVFMSMAFDAVLVMALEDDNEVTTDVVDMVGPCSEETGLGDDNTSDRVFGWVVTSIVPSNLIFFSWPLNDANGS